MRWVGRSNQWHNLFALFPVRIGGTDDAPLNCWLEWFEWRWKEWPYYERRAPGADETYMTYVAMD